MPFSAHTPSLPEACSAATPAWITRFEEQLRQFPDGVAVISGNSSMSYLQLSERANQVAQLLRSHGIGPGVQVGVCLKRCLELPIALLGILKSGAAYIPLDPAYPAARLEQMISSARLEWVLTLRETRASLGKTNAIFIEDAFAFPTAGLAESVSEHDPIYAIFTSGSTGQPKAASVFHYGFSNLIEWYGTELGLGAADCTLVISSPSFDLTQKNFYTPLATGGRLVLDDGEIYDISRITRLIRENRVTLINCTPSAFYPLVEATASNGYQDLASLRFAVLGGEPISIPRLRAWLDHPNCGAEVVNSYGPTECTDICLFHRLHKGNLDEFPFVPLGREIPNVVVTIRDEEQSTLADGEIGELCIEGISLGGGYLNDPEKTADRFINGIYRTGDLAKRLPCGTFEFRGRADYQVKVNGYRIELGEIELALSRHEHVREAVVIARENQLVAFICGTAKAAALREHVLAVLPAYMVPADFIFRDSLPLTPNGKVDRKALMAVHLETAGKTDQSSDLEGKILALWSEILNRPVHDATANFFDLGGNSIHLAVMHVRLREMSGRDFPITELFALPSARSIATFLAPKAAAAVASSAHDRARLAQAGFSRFRRPTTR